MPVAPDPQTVGKEWVLFWLSTKTPTSKPQCFVGLSPSAYIHQQAGDKFLRLPSVSSAVLSGGHDANQDGPETTKQIPVAWHAKLPVWNVVGQDDANASNEGSKHQNGDNHRRWRVDVYRRSADTTRAGANDLGLRHRALRRYTT